MRLGANWAQSCSDGRENEGVRIQLSERKAYVKEVGKGRRRKETTGGKWL